MSKQASKSLIGAFVLGALGLVVAGVVVFGSGGQRHGEGTEGSRRGQIFGVDI